MKLAPVVPPGAEAALPSDLDAYFCFATEIGKSKGGGYEEFYQAKSRGAVLVVDCPVYEGHEFDLQPKAWAFVAKLLRPTFMIIPDVRFDWKATIRRGYDYLAISDDISVTGVLQGATVDEVFGCAVMWYAAGVRRMAVPKDLAARTGASRSEIVAKVLQVYPDVLFHFLGANYPYTDEATAGQAFPENILSFDTAEPANFALTKSRVRPADWWTSGPKLNRRSAVFRKEIEAVRKAVEGARLHS